MYLRCCAGIPFSFITEESHLNRLFHSFSYVSANSLQLRPIVLRNAATSGIVAVGFGTVVGIVLVRKECTARIQPGLLAATDLNMVDVRIMW